MEWRREKARCGGEIYLLALLFVSSIGRISGLSVTVTDTECVQEYVLYEGDSVSGNFVVVDHDIFWSSDHPGIDSPETN
ncbi:transmembrane emp24 domain-containing protein p24beta3-like [Tripterygium wilfordii]|uniref:transmembrane emp24 domain-containing protein p24beta3-like n=1 Tax=Tripterygium wilfordii TaxID=458696 RepID=UPI0018F7EB3A|nr:transmembrane emp24 domain-containing protein p24beta3-like [Tripterygium wilfordii]